MLNMKKRTWIMPICSILALLIAITAVSYSWLRRDWKPAVFDQKIQIQTGATLTIIMENEDGTQTATDKLQLHEILKSPEEFRLKQVSNLTGFGDDFFCLNFDTGAGTSVPDSVVQHIDKPKNMSPTELGEENGYIETSFTLVGGSYSQNIFLHQDTHISIPDDAPADKLELYQKLIDSIRVVIDLGGGEVYGLKANSNQQHTGITNEKDLNGVYVAVGKNPTDLETPIEYTDENGESHTTYLRGSNDQFKSVEEWVVEPDENGDYTSVPENRVLFTSTTNSKQQVTIRVWLEGTAEGCINDIAGLEFDLAIVFHGVKADAS